MCKHFNGIFQEKKIRKKCVKTHFFFYKINGIASTIKTVRQEKAATIGSLQPLRDSATATIRAKSEDQMEPVALKIAGKVITDNVTYGT